MAKFVLKDKETGQDISWLEAVILSLKKLGHPAGVKEIFDCMVENVITDVPSTAATPMQTIYNTIYTHSHDSPSGQDNENIFYATEKKGVWGLANQETVGLDVGMSDDDFAFPEGKAYLEQHLHRERNRKVAKCAKEKFMREHDGKLFCEACGFDFSESYGQIGAGFIEAHHMKPVAQMQEGEKTSIKDIAMLCSNCHRMVHRTRPWISEKSELKGLIKENPNRSQIYVGQDTI